MLPRTSTLLAAVQFLAPPVPAASPAPSPGELAALPTSGWLTNGGNLAAHVLELVQ